MMEAQRKLKVAKTGEADSAVTITGTVEAFVQAITQRAISGVLEYEDQFFLRERIEADIAALEWVKLAQASGALSLKEGVRSLSRGLACGSLACSLAHSVSRSVLQSASRVAPCAPPPPRWFRPHAPNSAPPRSPPSSGIPRR